MTGAGATRSRGSRLDACFAANRFRSARASCICDLNITLIDEFFDRRVLGRFRRELGGAADAHEELLATGQGHFEWSFGCVSDFHGTCTVVERPSRVVAVRCCDAVADVTFCDNRGWRAIDYARGNKAIQETSAMTQLQAASP